jgi:uncharacterized membrane protein YgdD (TMEM256/DUF423 family)
VKLFPMAAPAGGMIMIGGWLLLAFAGVWELIAQRKPAWKEQRR